MGRKKGIDTFVDTFRCLPWIAKIVTSSGLSRAAALLRYGKGEMVIYS